MGQKVHPIIFRIGTINTWHSRWYSGKRAFPKLLREDQEIRVFLRALLKDAAVDRVDIERSANAITIMIASAKPGFIIGRAGTGAEELKEKLKKKFFSGRKVTLNLNITEVPRPALSANIVMQAMVADLEKRMPFRRILKMTADKVLKAGAKGVRLRVSGRLNGSEIARSEAVSHGSIPLHNLRADIDYAQGFARTIFGTIGVKVLIYRGEIFDTRRRKKEEKEDAEAAETAKQES
ncbi:30S ribosomal protein S3 [Patescibacteria group bacterium]|nr:MAG: 30S ribosomal protein S3 [Patescibacteria group bacterium]